MSNESERKQASRTRPSIDVSETARALPNRPGPLERPLSPAQLSAAELNARTRLALHAEYDRFVASLPPAADEWETECALYARESVPDSLVGDAAVGQLRNALELLASYGAVPPWENVYFENLSGTELAARTDFNRLLDRAMAGEFKLIGAYLSSRLFRNADEASVVKKQLKRRGVKLVWVGKPTGLDERDPSGWLMERNADVLDEWHSRQTGWLVGRQLEFKTRKGEPIGKLPECWEVTDWAPGVRPGRHGRPIAWKLAEPMASIVQAAAERYLAGDSWHDVALWSRTTALEGVTPKGRLMDWVWWNQLFKNPKLAGLHEVSVYPGYKAGKESPTRKELGITRELVPCLLPPVISVDDWEAIVERSRARHGSKGVSRRGDAPVELLSGIGYDNRCGHLLHITRHENGDYFMRCGTSGSAMERHGTIFAARAAGDELDALVSKMVLDDPLIAEITRALEAKAEEPEAKSAVPPPPAAVVKLRTAIRSMRGDADLDEARHQLEAKLRILEQEASAQRRPKGRRANRFAEAIAALRHWHETWSTATPAEKNKVLRAAGVRAYIEPTGWYRNVGSIRAKTLGPKSRLVRVESDVPEFALALAIGLRDLVEASASAPHGLEGSTWTGRVQIGVADEYAELIRGDDPLEEAA